MLIFILIIGINYMYGTGRLQIKLETKDQEVVVVQPNNRI